METMKHFGSEEWVDFARGVVPEKRKTAMRQHLESGCSDCRSAVQTWQRVYQMCRVDSSYEPPSSVVRIVKGNFALYRPEVKSRIPIVARLMFDTLGSPLLAGIRSGEAPARRLLYQAGSYEIDLQIEPQGHGNAIEIVGQLLSSVESGHPVDQAPVTLVSGKEAIAKSVTNSLGEFSLKSDVKGAFELLFGISEGTDFCVPVTDPKSVSSLSSPEKPNAGGNSGPRKKRHLKRTH